MDREREFFQEQYGKDFLSTDDILRKYSDEIYIIKKDYAEKWDGEQLDDEDASDRMRDTITANFADWLKEKYPNEYADYFG